MSAKVYLAGPVAGLTYDEAMAWRREAAKKLADYGLEAVFPMENEKALKDAGPLPAGGVEGVPGCSAAEIFESDMEALRQCDYLLCNLLGAKRPSLGSAWELGYAYNRADMVSYAVVAPGSIHDHVFITQGADYVFTDLDEAIRDIGEWEERRAQEQQPTDYDLRSAKDDERFMEARGK